MSLRLVMNDIWVIGLCLQALLALTLLARKSWQRYPIFSAYVVFNLFGTALTYGVFRYKIVYFYTFWICDAIGIVLGLGVVREIFTNVFSPHPALRKLATIIFRVAVVLLVILACGVIYAQSGNARGIGNGVLLAAEAARVVEVGLTMFLFLSSSAFGLHWRQSVFGMALGLGMFAAVELIADTMIGHVSLATAQAFNLAHSVSFCMSLLIWLGYLLVPERATSSGELPKKAQLEQWNRAVTELINR